MAAGGNDEELIDLAESISPNAMETIALDYLGLKFIKGLKLENRANDEDFNREVIRRWANRNSSNKTQILARLLYEAADEGTDIDPNKIEEILGISREEASLPPTNKKPDKQYYLDRAYIEACREGTKKVYNARMILVGYSEAGKTSLATRLLGEKFKADEKSTEGIALHHIESTFNNKEKQKKGGKWEEKSINTSDLKSIFSHAVWSRAQEMTTKRDASTGGKLGESQPSGPYLEEDTEVQNISNETREELLQYENVIVQPESEEETAFALSVWDLGGQDEFISTHHLFLNTEATILIVMDITKGLHRLIGGKSELGYLNSPAQVLHYWLNLFHSDAANHGRTPNIAIVLTHTDEIKGRQNDYIDDYKQQIMEMIQGKPYDKYIDMAKIYAVSNATGSDTDFKQLQDKLLQHLIKQPTWGYDMPVRWLKLKHDIIEKANKKGTMCLQLHKVWKLGEELRMDTDDVESFLHKQTALGDFVYIPEMKDLVIIEPKWLVNKCKDLISTHQFIDKRRDLPQSIRESLKMGHITESGLKQLWKNDRVIFLIKLMEKYDLLVDVSDQSRRKYIIPCMLGSKFHKDVPSKVLIGSFPQFVSKCSKEKNWKISQKDLSYTNVSFDIDDDVELNLSLSQPVQIQTQFKWKKNIDSRDRSKIQREANASLARILKTCQIQSTDDEGDTQLTGCMLWSLAQQFTNSTQLRTLGQKLDIDESKIDTSLTNYRHDINAAAYDVLRQWRDSQEDAIVAYKNICDALREAELNFFISKVLQ